MLVAILNQRLTTPFLTVKTETSLSHVSRAVWLFLQDTMKKPMKTSSLEIHIPIDNLLK